jgi:hypothetical protein
VPQLFWEVREEIYRQKLYHVYLFEKWLNESASTVGLSKHEAHCMEVLVYYCLGAFSPVGGNCPHNFISPRDGKEQAVWFEEPFGEEGPDLWVNCGDFDGKISSEMEALAKIWQKPTKSERARNDLPLATRRIEEGFAQYGMELETFVEEEIVVRLILPVPHDSYREYRVSNDDHEKNVKAVVKFYRETQPRGLKELGEKLRGTLAGKKFGI